MVTSIIPPAVEREVKGKEDDGGNWGMEWGEEGLNTIVYLGALYTQRNDFQGRVLLLLKTQALNPLILTTVF